MKVRGIEIKKGDRIHGFSIAIPGCWEVKSLRPFRVMAHQQGKEWYIDVTPSEWVLRKNQEE